MFLYFNTDLPNAVMNITIRDDITSGSFVVLWDEVMDIFTITYNVTLCNESGIIRRDTVNSPPYTVINLTANTSYNVTVVAINTCCGAGPVIDVTKAMTSGNVFVRNIINCISINKPSCVHVHEYIHTHTHAHTHIHIHRYIHMHT